MKFHTKVVSLLKTAVCVLGLAALAACSSPVADQDQTASGSISVTSISISSELGGKVLEVLGKEGDAVKSGEVLFRLDDAFLQAQKGQAAAAVSRAQSGLDLARAQLDAVQVQYELALTQARMQSQGAQQAAWGVDQPQDIELPAWYFQKSEEITAAAAEMKDASQALANEKTALEQVLKKNSDSKFAELEKNMAQAQAAYRTAMDTSGLIEKAKQNAEIKKAAQDALDQAKTNLASIQKEYDSALTSPAAQEILEGRARQAVAQTRFDQAVGRYNLLLTGEDSLQVKAAAAALTQAKAGIATAEAGLLEAQAALKSLELQLAKTEVKAPVDGVILSRTLEAGEIFSPGGTAMVIGRLEEATVTVYVPETQYGKISLGQNVAITVDSFAGKVFAGTVTHISDQAEFTPRNVQTVDGRRTTVYAVKITIPNQTMELKPGMPADVKF